MSKYLNQTEAVDFINEHSHGGKIGLDDFLLDYMAVGKVNQYRRKQTGETVYSEAELAEACGKNRREEAEAILNPKPQEHKLQGHGESSQRNAGRQSYVRR